MKDEIKGIQSEVLSEAFQAALQGWRLHSAVFLTFRFDPAFFEQEVLPVFFDIPLSHVQQARVLHLADALRTCGSAAVYYDRRALEPGSGPARTDFQRIGINHRRGYFHPKNVFLLVERAEDDPKTGESAGQRRLIVASMSANLTRAGWWENVEVAHLESIDDRSECSFAADIRDLLGQVRRLSPAGADHAALDEISGFARRLVPAAQRLSGGLLLSRMYSGNEDMPAFLDGLAGNRLRGRCLEVISPYFDDKESVKPLQALIDRFKPSEVRVFLPKGPEGEALCSPEYWDAVKTAEAEWAQLPATTVFFSKSRDRTVHAKVYRFFDPSDKRQTFFIGSVNLTNAGFSSSGNVESGFVIEVEGNRRSDWWLEVEKRRPGAFQARTEAESVGDGPGAKLVVRFNWTTAAGQVLWDAPGDSPVLTLKGSGVPIAKVGPLPSGELVALDGTAAARLQQHLKSSSFVTVVVDEAPDATVLVEEEGAVDKPSLLARLPPEEILRYWSLLTDDQKSEFIVEHLDELDDEQTRTWIPGAAMPHAQSMFATFAHVYLSFGNLERAVRKALDAVRTKEAVDRLFGRKFDSLNRLVEQIAGKGEPDAVEDYVTLLCALQLLNAVRRDYPEFAQRESQRFELVARVKDAAAALMARIQLDPSFTGDRAQFFEWLERWFLTRARPQEAEVAS